MREGSQSEVGKLERVVLKHAKDAFVSDEKIGREWRGLNFDARPDYGQAVAEYDQFARLLKEFGVDIDLLPADQSTGLDSIYVRDATVVCNRGVVLCNMGKAQRTAEPPAQETALRELGIRICGAITEAGRVEGGDVVWIDDRTLAVGRSYRTNDEGIRQLAHQLGDCLDELIEVPLPHWRGPTDVFHLMSIISPIDHDLAVVYSPLLPVPFREALIARGIRLVEVADSEFATMGCNVLAVAPRVCVMLSGNPETKARLEAVGASVYEFEGKEICLKGAGGPTCLTRPVMRAG